MAKRIVVLASGGGSNFQALIDAQQKGELDVEIAGLIVDNTSAPALLRATRSGIDTAIVSKRTLAADLLSQLDRWRPDLIVLAGFLSIIPDVVVAAYRGRIINIHPSLLPEFSGKGYYGIAVHEAVLAAQRAVSGATTHYVDEGIDTGAIIMQRAVAVLPDDTAHALQQRVLALEHELLVDTLRLICAAGESL